MSEITELNGFGSQDWPNRANNTDPVINPHPPFRPHPAGWALHPSRTARAQPASVPSSQACVLNNSKERGRIHAQQKWVRIQLKYYFDLI